MKRIFFLMAAFVLVLIACQRQSVDVVGKEVNADDGVYTNVNADELNAMLNNKDFVFVNVHIPFEGDITDTDLSIPYDQISAPENLSQLPADKNAKIVLYCRSGRMSAIAAEELVSLGYTNIWNLTGGMVDWEQAGYPLEK
ncbi:MAG TPA: rhodanese-like domain-containing protein [Anaerolineales bacterium]|nr:rhodanese-like domain-containing protein [Anaerolineales bacterium]